ncbi:Alpha/Beta hydrolase protein [Boeremia exigua]|uniref:Alpha/Beta hydrolase protein n=1 Tax=Boeremia exigua TaxID=749465 RepID=UPI001E8E164C|nr:Alpha/Beta hydrolase protein [Boeremia exigua]KAH6641994.1 Alpha/Beta hydrolase protein [Boeremia exigua]
MKSPALALLALPTALALLALPTALAASGCRTPLPPNLAPGTSTHNLTLASRSVIGTTTQREYILHLPAGYNASNDEPAPLIVAFHGQSQPAWSMERISGFSDPAWNTEAVVVYPQGLDVQEPGVQWLGDPLAPPASQIDDRLFATELLDHLTSTLCLDPSRLYAAGLSNGGGLTGLLMCDPVLNTRFAAFATVAGAFYPDASTPAPLFEGACQPALGGRKLPYLNMHGRADAVVAYNGTNVPPPASIPVPEWVGSWAARNGCGAPRVREAEAGTVQESTWTCGGVDAVVHRAIDGFGHGWPSVKNQGEPFETLRGGPTTWDATPLILEWFGRWAL